MKWQLEISDIPDNPLHPIVGRPLYDNGVKGTPRYFTISNIIDALRESVSTLEDVEGEASQEEHSPILPKNTIRYSKSLDGKRQRITMEIPKHKTFIKHDALSDDLVELGFPRMVVQFLVEKTTNSEKPYVMRQTRIFAVRDDKKPIQETTPLFDFPFPNVMKGSGVVCWGGNSRLEYTCLSELERAFVWFTSAPFNEDYGISLSSEKTTFLKYLEHFHSQDFNEELLKPLKKDFSSLFENN